MMQQPIEGMTRTNRRTGEVQAFRGGTWATVQPGNAPATPGIVEVAPAQARQPPPQTPAQAQNDVLTNQRLQQQIGEGALDAAAAARAEEARSGETRQRQVEPILSAIFDARNKVGGWTTGFAGQVLDQVGGTDANDLRSSLDTIRANLAFDRLQAMRDASPTGGALGNVTEMELRLLQSSLAALDQSQSEGQLRTNLDRVELHYLNFLNALQGNQRTDNVEQARALYRGVQTQTPGGQIQFGDEQREGVQGPRLTPEQEAEYYALLERRPSPDQIQQFFRERGFSGGVLNAEDVARAAGEGQINRAVGYDATDEAERRRVEEELRASEGFSGPESAASTRLQTGMTLGLRDEVAGIGRGLSRLVQGRNPLEGYVLGRDAERLRADRARGNFGGIAGGATEIIGGLMSANPTASIAPVTTRSATIAQGARGGAVGGGIAGFGYGEGLEGSASNALVGALAGGAMGAGISALASRGGGGPPAARIEGPELAAAARRQGVPINAANVRPGARNALAYLESSPGSAGPVQRNLGAQAQRLEERAESLGAGGAPLTTDAAGNAVRTAGERFISRTRGVKDKLYDAAERAAGNARIPATTAVQRIRQRITELRETPSVNQARIEALEEVLQDLAMPDGSPRPITVAALRDMRSGMRASLQRRNLTMTQAETDVVEALDAVSDDIASGLTAQSPRAAQLYRRADGYYRQRQGVIRDVLQRVLGRPDNPLSGERVFAQLQSMASPKSGDAGRLARLMQTLEPADRSNIASTIAERLGRANPGDDFSPAHFVSQAGQLSPSARRIIFGNDGAQAIDDLERLSRSLRNVQRRLNNSRSGQVAAYADAIRGLFLGGGGGFLAAGPAAGVAGAMAVAGGAAAGRRVTAALLLNRKFTGWLARAPRSSDPRAIQAHIRSLGSLGRGTPVGVEAQNVQRMLQQQFAPAAADSSDNQE